MEATSVGHPRSQIDAVKKITCIEHIKLVGAVSRLKNIKWSSIGRSRQLVLKNIKTVKTTVHNNKPIERSISKRLQFCQRGEVTLEQHQLAINEVMTVATGVGFTQLLDVAQEALRKVVDRMEQDGTANAQWITREVRKMRMNGPNSIDPTTLEVMDRNVKLEAVKVKAFIDMAIKVASTIPEILVLPNDQRCSFCNLLGHDPVECTMTPADKISVSVKQGACLRCLRVHRNEECTSTATCEHCNGDHHSTICSTSPKYAETLGYIKPNVRKPCAYCKGPHIALQCKLSPQAKKIILDSENACQRCLSRDHQLDNCQHSYRCRHCKGAHYYLHCSMQRKPEPLEEILKIEDGQVTRDLELEQLQKALDWAQSLQVKGTNSNVQGNPKDKQSQRIQEESTSQESQDNNNNKGSKTTEVSRQINDEMPTKRTPAKASDQISETRSVWVQPVVPEIFEMSPVTGYIQTCQESVPSKDEATKLVTKESKTPIRQGQTPNQDPETITEAGECLDNSNSQSSVNNQDQGRSRKRQRGLSDSPSPDVRRRSSSYSDEGSSEDEEDIYDVSDETASTPCVILAHYSWDAHFIRIKVFMRHIDKWTEQPLMYCIAESLEFHRYDNEWSNTKEAITRAAFMIKTFMTKAPRVLIPTVVVLFHTSHYLTESITNKREVEFFKDIKKIIMKGPLPTIQFFQKVAEEPWDSHHHDEYNDAYFDAYARDRHKRFGINWIGSVGNASGHEQTGSDSDLVFARRECFVAVCQRIDAIFSLKVYKLQLDKEPDNWELVHSESKRLKNPEAGIHMEVLTREALDRIRDYVQKEGNEGYRIKTILIVHNEPSINTQLINSERPLFFLQAKSMAKTDFHGTFPRFKFVRSIPDPRDEKSYKNAVRGWWNSTETTSQRLTGSSEDTKDSLEKEPTDRSSEEEPTQENLLSSEDLQKADHSAPGVSRG